MVGWRLIRDLEILENWAESILVIHLTRRLMELCGDKKKDLIGSLST